MVVYKKCKDSTNRNHGLLNISPNDFFETELIIPKSFEK